MFWQSVEKSSLLLIGEESKKINPVVLRTTKGCLVCNKRISLDKNRFACSPKTHKEIECVLEIAAMRVVDALLKEIGNALALSLVCGNTLSCTA